MQHAQRYGLTNAASPRVNVSLINIAALGQVRRQKGAPARWSRDHQMNLLDALRTAAIRLTLLDPSLLYIETHVTTLSLFSLTRSLCEVCASIPFPRPIRSFLIFLVFLFLLLFHHHHHHHCVLLSLPGHDVRTVVV